MKSTENKLVIGRRNALKILGLSSAALFTGGFGNISSAEALEMEYKPKPLVNSGRSRVAFTTGTDRRAMMFEVMKPFEEQIREGMKGKQLVIKPNMVSTNMPLCATHVDALRGLLYTYVDGKRYDTTHLHMREWLECIRQKQTPSCNIDQAFQEAMTAHMGTRAYLEGRTMYWDKNKEEIVRGEKA